MADEAAGPTLHTNSNHMQSQLCILLCKHLGFPRHEVCHLEWIGLLDFQDILSYPPLQIPFLGDHLKTKPGRQVRSFMAFCYWYHHHHRSLTPDEYLVYYAEGNSRTSDRW